MYCVRSPLPNLCEKERRHPNSSDTHGKRHQKPQAILENESNQEIRYKWITISTTSSSSLYFFLMSIVHTHISGCYYLLYLQQLGVSVVHVYKVDARTPYFFGFLQATHKCHKEVTAAPHPSARIESATLCSAAHTSGHYAAVTTVLYHGICHCVKNLSLN